MPLRPVVILAGALAFAGCGGPPRPVSPRPNDPAAAIPPPDPSTLAGVYLLESGGTPPEDTVVAVAPGRSRTILVRRGAPDNSLFAVVTLPAAALDSTRTDSVRITIRPLPGLYGIELSADGPISAGATLALSYAVHFIAPTGARERYGNDLGFERALFLAQEFPDGRVVFLPTSRPGSDLVAAALPGPGRYLVAAPR